MAVKYQRYWDSDEKKYKYRQISGLNEPKKTTKQIYQDSLKTDYKGFTGSGTTSAKERKLESKAKAVQKKTATDWKKSRAGAQGQATTKTAGKTADKVQFDFDNILAPKKAKAGVGTGNDGIDILLGKGVCADSNGLYNNVNRQADRITLDKILRDAELEKNTNIGYNKGDRNKNSETTPATSTNIEEIEKPHFVAGKFYAPFEGTAGDPGPFSLLPEDTRAKLDEAIEETRNSSEQKNKAVDTEESSGGGFGGGGGEAWESNTFTPENKGEYENDIWRQAEYKGYFDGDWYFEKDKVIQAAEILLDETKLNGGLNLKKLQENKTKRELFKALLYLLGTNPVIGNNLSQESMDFETVAGSNGWGDVNPYNVTPEQLEALINRFDENMNLSKEELIALHVSKLALPVLGDIFG